MAKPKVKNVASGAPRKSFGSAGGSKIGGGSNKRGGALFTSPAKDALISRKFGG